MHRSTIKALAKENDNLRQQLRIERGEERPGEIIVRRCGDDLTSALLFSVRLSISVPEAAHGGDAYIEAMLDRMRREIKGEIERRAGHGQA